MQQQSHAVSPTPLSRMIPSRPAAVMLLALDALLLAMPLFLHWQDWFVFAYVPLLITVALGILMSGRGRLAIVLTGIVVPVIIAGVWATLMVSAPSMDLLDIVLHAGAIALAGVGAVCLCIAAWGWVKFFAGGR